MTVKSKILCGAFLLFLACLFSIFPFYVIFFFLLLLESADRVLYKEFYEPSIVFKNNKNTLITFIACVCLNTGFWFFWYMTFKFLQYLKFM